MIPPESIFSDLTPEELRARLARCEAERQDLEAWVNDRNAEGEALERLQSERDRLQRLVAWYKGKLAEFVRHVLGREK